MKFNNIIFGTQKMLCALFFSISMLGLSGCTDNFEKINKNPLRPDKEMEKLDDVIYGMYLPSMQKTVIPTGTNSDGTEFINKYQVAVNMSGDAWSGYMSVTENKFDGGQNLTTYFLSDAKLNFIYSSMVTDVFAPWLQIKKNAQESGTKNDEIYSISQIIKIAALHRATDTFGPIPYTSVGTGNFKVPYNSQEEVYKSFFTELEQAIQLLSVYSESNARVLDQFDVVYEGDVNKWIKFANSLMLRLAIRVRYVEPELAKEYAEKAVSHYKGLIESMSDAPKLSKGAGITFRNSMHIIWDSYGDAKMGATVYTYLKGYEDPRIEKYFQATTVDNKKGYFAVRTSIPQVQSYKTFSNPNIMEDTPTYWMRVSETYFLRAEGALAGWSMGGSAQSLYEQGIRISFQENEVQGVEDYLASTKLPARYEDAKNAMMSVEAPSSITVKWNATASEEEMLEKIITQKYLAIFPNGVEAWTEWRRTGYPKQILPVLNLSNYDATTGDGVSGGMRRLPFPRKEYDENFENVQNAVNQYLGARDKSNVNVWWDKKNN